MIALAPLLQEAIPAVDMIGDALIPIGGAAFALALIRMAVNAHDKRCTTAEARETFCATQLAATIVAQTALTTELKAGAEDERRRWDPINRGMTELLDRARRDT